MSNFFLSPNMNLVVPVVGTELGPNWANDLNASLLTVDSHTHSAGSGVPITPTGININADLPFNNANNAIGLRSVRFFPQVAALGTASDLGCLYEVGVDLYYNDGGGNQIRITQSGNVSGSAGTITGLPSGTASASFQSASGTFQFQQATSTAANIDAGSLIIRYPGSYPTPSGNYILLEAPSSLASGYSITLPALPAQTNVMTLGATGIISSITYDSVASNMTATGANTIGGKMTSVGANSIFNTTTRIPQTPNAGSAGVAYSGSSGSFTTTSGSPTDVGISCTLPAAGTKPIRVLVQWDGIASSSSLIAAGGVAVFQILANGSAIGIYSMGGNERTPGSALSAIQLTPSAIPYTYTMTAATAGTSASVVGCALVAYEI